MAVANGGLRRASYGKRVSDLRAHQIATATLVPVIFLYARWVERRHPLASTRSAAAVGAAWTAATLTFEFGFGHFVGGESWEKLVEAYDIRSGHVWVAVPTATLAAPLVAHWLRPRL